MGILAIFAKTSYQKCASNFRPNDFKPSLNMYQAWLLIAPSSSVGSISIDPPYCCSVSTSFSLFSLESIESCFWTLTCSWLVKHMHIFAESRGPLLNERWDLECTPLSIGGKDTLAFVDEVVSFVCHNKDFLFGFEPSSSPPHRSVGLRP